MDARHSMEEETLETLRETARALEKGLTEARRAIAELEARLAWSHSRVSETSTFTREQFGAAPAKQTKAGPPPAQG